MDTTEPGERSHDFELWHGVIIAIVGMLAISFTFIGICVKCRRKEGGRYIHQTKPMKSEICIDNTYYMHQASCLEDRNKIMVELMYFQQETTVHAQKSLLAHFWQLMQARSNKCIQ